MSEDDVTRAETPANVTANPGAATIRELGHERYIVLDELGRGGMGAVVMCEDRQIGRRVAMKLLHERGAERPGAERRFVREARVQGQLEHPAVVPVYDLGVDPQGTPYFTMKRVRGVTLKAILRKLANPLESDVEQWSLRRLLTAFATVCLAVDFAHRHGVIHRDIKPANVMLGDWGEVYLLDWGLARLGTDAREEAVAGTERVVLPAAEDATRHTSLLGTPGYMAPEQIARDAGAIGPAADIYALGAVLFEILTLERLHPTETEAALESTLRGKLDLPSERTPERGILPELAAICAKATALAPGERFASARELERAIERYLDGERDEQRRRELAAEHVRLAARSLKDESVGPLEQRQEAMREIGRALALDPQNERAVSMLLGLLSTRPEVTPPEVHGELEASFWKQVRAAGKVAGTAYLSLFLYAPLFFWSGIRDPVSLTVFYALALVSAALTFAVSGSSGPRPGLLVGAMLVSNATFAMTATFFGSLVLTPGLVAVNTAAYVLLLRPPLRSWSIVAGVVAVLVPAVPELVGSGGRYLFDASGMLITPGAIDLSRAPVLVLLLLGSVATVLIGAVTNLHIRGDLSAAEERLQLQAWQLAQLAPTRRS